MQAFKDFREANSQSFPVEVDVVPAILEWREVRYV
jgi:hypothetical protein